MSYFSKLKITDAYGFNAELTPTGEIRVSDPVRLCGSTFNGSTVDTNFWTVTNANNGTTTQAGSLMTIATNVTSPNGSSIVYSRAVARHVGGNVNRYRGQLRLNNVGVANNSRKWGAFCVVYECKHSAKILKVQL